MEKIMRWLIIGGTSESLTAVVYLLARKAEVYVSVATDMGAELYKDYPVTVWTGRMDTEQFEKKMAEEEISHVLDTSHPYALEVTENVRDACRNLGIDYFRYTRMETLEEMTGGKLPEIYRVKSSREASLMASLLPGKILLTTGVQTLDVYSNLVMEFQERCYARVLDNPSSRERCEEIFEDSSHWRAENPPFDVECNRKLLRETGAKLLITKDSGAAGGLPEKLEAARLEGVGVILISRPKEKDVLESLKCLNKYFE